MFGIFIYIGAIARMAYSFWSKILELYGLAWWKVKPIGCRSKRKKKKEAPRED